MVNTNTVKGAAKEMAGKAKAAVGKATGEKDLEIRGRAEEAAGKAQKAVGKAISKARSALD